MQYKFFNISCFGDAGQEEILNNFLRSNKIISIDKQLINVEGQAYWSFCVRWIQQNSFVKTKEKIDYSQTLTKDEFIRFEKLKVIRKELSQKLGIPAYAVFTNNELSNVTKLKKLTGENFLSIEGIGSGKMEKVGNQFIEMYNEKSK